MPTVKFRLLNVFAETTFGGNPLAVIEDGSALSDEQMQLIARQFNLSETVFHLAVGGSRRRASASLRPPMRCRSRAIRRSVPPHVVSTLHNAGDAFALEMGAGVIPVQRRDGRWTLSANPPTYRPMEASKAQLAAMLGLPEAAIGGPALWVNCGTEQPMIPLTAVDYVHAARPDAALMAQLSVNSSGQAKTYIFARTDDGFEARYFWMTSATSISEDPGTGSACANLGGWWQATQARHAPLTACVHQAATSSAPIC